LSCLSLATYPPLMAKLVPVSKASTIKEALSEAGFDTKPSDVYCYEVQKKEDVSAAKVVALLKHAEEKPLLGDAARAKVGLPVGKAGTVNASSAPAGFTLFVQSTSHNRKMPAGSKVLLLRAAPADAKRAAVEVVEHEDEHPAKKARSSAASTDKSPETQAKSDTACSGTKTSHAGSVSTGSWHTLGSVCAKDFGSLLSKRVAAFDMDSTIINTKSGKTFPVSKDDWVLWSPEHVPQKLKQLSDEGYKVVLITNQGGIEKGKTSLADIQSKIDAVQKAVAVPWLAVILTKNDLYRKPIPTVWGLIEKSFNSCMSISKKDSFYCGDAAGRVPPVVKKKDFSANDLKFALNLGIQFFTPEECFLGKSQKYDREFEFDPRKLGVHPKAFPMPDLKKQTLALCVGPPASGKSSIATKHLVSCTRVNQDTLKTKEKCLKACEAALKEGKSVIVDNQNKTKADRAPYLALAKKAGADCIAIRFDVPKDLCFHLNTYRKLNAKDDLHRAETVPSMVIHAFYKNVEEPDKKEGFAQVFRAGLEHFCLRDDTDLSLMRSFLD